MQSSVPSDLSIYTRKGEILSVSLGIRRIFLFAGGLGFPIYHMLMNLYEGSLWYNIPSHSLFFSVLDIAFLALSFVQGTKPWFRTVTSLLLLFVAPIEAALTLFERGITVYPITAWVMVNQLIFMLIDSKKWMKIFVLSQVLFTMAAMAGRQESVDTWLFMLVTLTVIMGINYYFNRQKISDLQRYLSEREENIRTQLTVHSLIQSTDDLIWSLDHTYRLTAFNTAFEQMTEVVAKARIQKGDSLYALSAELRYQLNLGENYEKAFKGINTSFEQQLKLGTEIRWYSFAVNAIQREDSVIGVSVFGRNITAQKEMEASLRQRERRYDNALAGAEDGVWEWNLETNGIYMSPRMKDILGLPPHYEVTAPYFLQMLHPEDSEGVIEKITQHIKGKTAQLNGEYRMVKADGEEIWVLGRGKAFRDAKGKAKRIAGAISDITARKRDELLLTNILNNSLNGIAAYEAVRDEGGEIIDLRWTLFNKTAEMMGGIAAEDLLGRNLIEDMPLFRENGTFERYKKVIETGKPSVFKLEIPVNEEMTETRWYHIVAFKLGDGLGVNYSDITDSLEAEARLKTLSLVAEKTGSVVIITDEKGRVEWVNEAFELTTGYKLEEVVGKIPGQVLQGKDTNPATIELIRKKLKARIAFTTEILNYTKEGTPYWVQMNVTPVFGEDQQLEKFIAVESDITERKQTELVLKEAKEAAESATRAKSEFLATMSHEIRTPMNAVIGMTGLLLDTPLTEEQVEYAETIRTSGDNLLTVINDILDFSKIDSGKLELEAQTFDLTDVVEDVLDLLSAKAQEKSLELTADIAHEIPEQVISDPTRISQVLVNLVGNAIKFTDTGEVQVKVKYDGPEGENGHILRVEVTDTGIGISPEKKARLFQPFSQVDASITRKYGGTGLGLVICKMLVNLMGGEIGIESTIGKGSTFFFTLRVQAGEPSDVKLSGAQGDIAGLKVLLVDDNATNLLILQKHCSLWGLEVQATQYPREAYEWLQAGTHFDLAILDGMMPEWSGEDLAGKIRSLPEYRDLPLILLTSMWQDLSPRGLELFACKLSKPVRRNHLLKRIRQVVGKSDRVDGRHKEGSFSEKKNTAEFPALSILLVEDNAINQKVALRMLSKLGYKADVAANGLEALKAVELKTYDLCFMDMQMPEMDGITATQELLKRYPDPTRRPVIIAMTANAMKGDRERCLEAGMDDYISKPVKMPNLKEAILHWFGSGNQEGKRASGSGNSLSRKALS